MAEDEVEITIKWSGKEFPFKLSAQSTVLNLKENIEAETKVLVCRQKLFGLKTKGSTMFRAALYDCSMFFFVFKLENLLQITIIYQN